MENLTEAQQQRALKNFVYRQNYYNKYQKENRDKFVQSSKTYFDGLMNDEEKKAEYKQKKKDYYQRVGKERYQKRMEAKKRLKEEEKQRRKFETARIERFFTGKLWKKRTKNDR